MWSFISNRGQDAVEAPTDVSHGKETVRGFFQEQREDAIERYIKENISSLSPEPEVLGGTFYVTEISFTGNSSGVVEYEDGHIALVADFIYSFDGTESPNVIISNVHE